MAQRNLLGESKNSVHRLQVMDKRMLHSQKFCQGASDLYCHVQCKISVLNKEDAMIIDIHGHIGDPWYAYWKKNVRVEDHLASMEKWGIDKRLCLLVAAQCPMKGIEHCQHR
jgi:hypothetical protein